jgi:hypothetical protein
LAGVGRKTIRHSLNTGFCRCTLWRSSFKRLSCEVNCERD